MEAYEDKKEELHQRMEELTRQDTAVAFSGGVDSSLLLKLAVIHAHHNGTRVYAMTANTELHPACDLEIAQRQAGEIGAEHLVYHLHELQEADVADNPVDRCYRCKKYLFRTMQQEAEKRNVSVLIEGTNEDDLKVYRPGIRALRELGIQSPLMDAHLTKTEVRAMAGEYGILVAERPSTPCLATRFPYGTAITMEKLERVEQGEAYLKKLGFTNLRLRIHGDIARVEADPEQFCLLLEHRGEVTAYLKSLGYSYITLDLEGFRSGSMDIHVETQTQPALDRDSSGCTGD